MLRTLPGDQKLITAVSGCNSYALQYLFSTTHFACHMHVIIFVCST